MIYLILDDNQGIIYDSATHFLIVLNQNTIDSL